MDADIANLVQSRNTSSTKVNEKTKKTDGSTRERLKRKDNNATIIQQMSENIAQIKGELQNTNDPDKKVVVIEKLKIAVVAREKQEKMKLLLRFFKILIHRPFQGIEL